MGLFDRLNDFAGNIRDRGVDFLYRSAVRLGQAAGLSVEQIDESLTNPLFDRVTRPISEIYDETIADSSRYRYYSQINTDEVPNENSIQQVDWISARYGYMVEYDIYDAEGNFVGSQRSRVDTNELLTQNQLQERFTPTFRTSTGIELATVNNLRIHGALHNPNLQG